MIIFIVLSFPTFALALSFFRRIANLTTLDVARNNLEQLGPIHKLQKLKSLNCDDNKLPAGSLSTLLPPNNTTSSSKLQNLSAGGNLLGNQPSSDSQSMIPPLSLPSSLKQLTLSSNHFSFVPPQVCSASLSLLEKLDLSHNQLASIPSSISNLKNLRELILDYNLIVSLPSEIGHLSKLKVLSLKYNAIRTTNAVYNESTNPQPLPRPLFEDTPLIDLNLHGNQITFTALTNFEGFDKFLERRQHVKSKDLYGGALTNLDVCGLE